MTTATASSLLEIAKSVLELSRRSTMKMVADISADKFCHQPVPGANHAMWILGHLANTDNWFATTLGKRESVLDESWGKMFGMKTTPVSDPSGYPSVEDVKAGLERARQSLLEALDSMDEPQLLAPLPEAMEGFAPNIAGAMSTLGWHEGLHAGQISAVRRSLGLPHALEVG